MRTTTKKFFNLLIICCICITTACDSKATTAKESNETSLPKFMAGTWFAGSALADQGASNSIQGIDDTLIIAKHRGRIFTFSDDVFKTNIPELSACPKPSFTPEKMTADALVKKSITTRLTESTAPGVRDLGLPFAPNDIVNVFYLTCDNELRAKDPGMAALADMSNVIWVIKLNDQQLALSWHDQTILVLDRLDESVKPSPSYDCNKAGTIVEKTICSDVGLAAYDKSLAEVYALVKTQYKKLDPEILQELNTSQKQWLKDRNECGEEKSCLEKAISIRIDDLIYDLGDFLMQNRQH